VLNLQPILTGKLVKLRPLESSDFEELYSVASDPLIWDQHPFPRYDKHEFNEYFEGAIASKSALVIIDTNSQKIIGTSRYYNLEEDHVFIGYTFLARSHWGGAVNRELKDLMLGHAFKKVSKVYFDIGETNLRSRRAIEKIGATFVKTQMNRGKPYTVYVIDRDTFLKN
jgi:N-acetyltransferase